MRSKHSGIRHSGFGIRAGVVSRAVLSRAATCIILLALGGAGFQPARADVDPVSGIDLVRITSPGNAAYAGPDPFGQVTGRGRVDYEYRIGKFEVTSAQWVEFFSAFYARATPINLPAGTVFAPPVLWGGGVDPTYSGPGLRYRVNPNNPNAAMLPAGGITWRAAAIFCNWLHNNKSTDPSAFLSGAYDVSTFSATDFPTFTDQAAHSPGARYYIPTWDEWLKAAHYDPNKQNPDGSVGGWWQNPYGGDAELRYGPPLGFAGGSAENQANSGWRTASQLQYTVPLGAYATSTLPHTSPWGLFDVAGGTSEFTESIREVQGFGMFRVMDGSAWGADALQELFSRGAQGPRSTDSTVGLRIAAAIPAPGATLVLTVSITGALHRRRRTPR